MPTRPASFSARLNASRRVSGAQVLQGQQRAQTATQQQMDAVRKSYRWRCVAAQVLREEPCCRTCEAAGRTTAAKQVDHIVPLRENIELAFVRSNLQGLCASCHARKGADERGLQPRLPR